jgi:phage shock protein A
MVGAFLTTEAVARLPIPSTLRGVVTDLALGDPVSPFIRVIVAERPITLLRNVVVSKAGEVVETSKIFNASEYVSKLREFLIQKVARFSDQVEKSVKALEDNIKSIMKSKGSLEASMSDIKQGVLRYGIDGMRDLALKYINFVDTYVKPFTAKDLVKTFESLAESIYIKSVKIPEKIIRLKTDLFKEASMKILAVKPETSLEVLKDLLERMRLTREAFAKAKTLMPSVVQKIRMPETLATKISKSLADINNLSKILGSVELRRIISTTETMKDMTSKAKDALRFIGVFSENLPESLRKTVTERAKEISVSIAKLESLVEKISESLRKVEERVKEVKKLEETGKIKPEEAFTKVREAFTGFTEDLRKILNEHPELRDVINVEKIRELISKTSSVEELSRIINEEVLNKLRRHMTAGGASILSEFDKLLRNMLKDPEIASRYRSFIETLLSNVNEMTKVEMPKQLMISLSPETLTLLMKLSPEGLPREVSDILKKAINEKRLTLSELEKLTDEIAKISPVSAGAIEIKAITDALRSILKDVKIGIEKIPSELRSYLDIAVRSVEEKIYEAEKIISRGVEMTRMKVVEGLSSVIRRESETVLSLLKEVSPTLEEKLRTSLDKLSKELSAGKINEGTIKEVMSALREASDTLRKTGVMPGQLKRTLLRFISDLKEGASEDVQLAKLLSPIADELIRILNTIPEIEGWGFVSLDISTSRAGMLMAPPEMRQWIREEIAKGRTVKEVKIGDVSIRLYKNIVLDPRTNTFTIEYRLVYPEGREAVIGLSTRVTNGYVHRTFYSSMDPVLVQAYKEYTSGNVKSPLYKIGESLDELYKDPQRFMETLDPDFDKWKNIAVYGSSSGMIKIGDILNASVTGLVNILSTARMEAKPPEKLTTEEQLFLASASAPKDALINATRPLITATPDEIAQEVVSKGYSPVGYVNPKIFITEYVAPAIEKLMKTNRDIMKKVIDVFNDPNILRQLNMSFSDLVKSIGVEGFLKNIMNMIPEPVLIDLVDRLRSAIPQLEDVIRKITWALDNVIVFAVPTSKPFIPSKEEWVALRVGDLTIPVPIIGRFMGKRVTIVPVMTEKIAEEFKAKIAPVTTQVQLPLLTIQYITPETAIQVPITTAPPEGFPLTIVSQFAVAPQLGALTGAERRGVGRGVQREVLTVL